MNFDYIFSACFLDYNNQIFVLASSCHQYGAIGNPKNIHVFNLNGNKIKEIKYSKDQTSFIDTFYDNKSQRFL